MTKSRQRPRLAMWLLVGFLSIAVAVVWYALPNDDLPKGAQETGEFPLPTVAESAYLNTRESAHYIGREQCQTCHADEHASYLRTAHSRSLVQVHAAEEPPDGTYFHEASGRCYSVYRKDDSLHHAESIPLEDGSELPLADHSLKYRVGSGRFSRTYLVEKDGFLMESPVTWYSSLKQWAMSPGYDEPDHRSFHRVAGFDCLYCHTGRIEKAAGSMERVAIHETVIGCERCHGPGSLHAEKWRADGASTTETIDLTIVNPRNLPRELQEAVCHQCHLESVVRSPVRGRTRDEFRPGLHWQDFFVNYTDADSGDMTVTGHVEQMRQSRCYQQSKTMTCITCHDPHDTPADQHKVTRYRHKCLECHQVDSCGISVDQRASRNEDNCVACHMPNSATDIAHIAFTHHRIAVHDHYKSSVESKSPKDLRPVLDISRLPEIDRRRSLGLAYQTLFHDTQDKVAQKAYLVKAAELMEEVAEKGLTDGTVCATLAEIFSLTGNSSDAEQWAIQAQETDSMLVEDQIRTSSLLAWIYAERGQTEDARKLLRALIKIRRSPADWFLLGVCEQRLGDFKEAESAFRRVLEIDPGQPETYQALAELKRISGLPPDQQLEATARLLSTHRNRLTKLAPKSKN